MNFGVETSTVTVRNAGSDRGIGWLTDAWALFAKVPGIWVVMLLIMMVIYGVLGALPFSGLLASLVGPVFGGGLMLAAQRQDRGQDPEIGMLFDGFKGPLLSQLILLGVAALAVCLAIGLVVGILAAIGIGGSLLSGQGHGVLAGVGIGVILLGAMIGLLLLIPLSMAMWFAPALVALAGVKPIEALRLSFDGCLKNLVPFLIYGVLVLVALLVGMIPFGLGLLIVMPVLALSTYVAYKDIFVVEAGDSSPTAFAMPHS